MLSNIYKASSVSFSDKKIFVGENAQTVADLIRDMSKEEMEEYLDSIPESQRKVFEEERLKVSAILENEKRLFKEEKEKFEKDRMRLIELSRIDAQNERQRVFDDARAEVDVLLRDKIKDAETKAQETRDSILQSAQLEAQKIKEDAYNEGYASGMAEGGDIIYKNAEKYIGRIEEFIGYAEGKLDEFIFSYEKDLKWGILQIARKVLNRMVSEDELNMEDMIIGAVDSVRDAEWIDIKVSAEAHELINELREELSVMDNVNIKSSNINKDEAVVSTSKDVLAMSVDTQLDNIEAYFKAEYLPSEV